MYKFCFYVPESEAEKVKSAVFLTGAGQIGNYDCCCWQTLGTGQFRPLSGSQPFIGQTDQLETVSELKVEMVCSDELIAHAVRAMKIAHPYEEPAYEVSRLEDF